MNSACSAEFFVQRLILQRPAGLDVDINNTGRKEKWDTEKKWLLQQCTCTMLSSSWTNRCVSLRLQTLFSWHLDLRIHGSSHKHYMGWSCSWSWWKKENFKAFRKKPFFSRVHEFFWHHVDKNALCYKRVLKFGRTSTSNNLSVFTAVIKLSAFVNDFVKQSAKQLRVEKRARSWILPEQVSFRNMKIMWIVFFSRELFLLLSPGSSRQSLCEFMQPHLTCPSTIHGRTGMKRNIAWMNTMLPRLLRVLFS